MHAERAYLLQNSCIGDSVLPPDPHDSSQAAKVEAFQAVLLSSVGCQRLTVVQQGAKDACLIHLKFAVQGQLVVFPHSLAQLRHDCSGLSDAFVDLGIK